MNIFRNNKISHAIILTAALAAPAMAQNLTQFVNGEVANAAAVNANFTAVKNAATSASTTANAAQATADAAQAAATAAQNTASAAQASLTPLTNFVSVNGNSANLDGRVGIGISSPQARLQIVNNGDPAPLMKLGEGQVWDVYAGATDFAISRSGIDFPFIIRSDTGNVGIAGSPSSNFKLDVTGNIRCTTLTQTSSRDLKQNITPLSGALDSVMKLRSVTYAWNDRAPAKVQDTEDIGFIADEVDAVLPQLVTKDANGKAIGIAYGKITSVNVSAIQELARKVLAKDAAIAAMQTENDELRDRLRALEQAVAQMQPLLAKK